MAISEVGFVDNSTQLAHYAMLARIKAIAPAHGWTILRDDTSTATHELILRGEGLSGDDEIFVGFQCYQDAAADYYNIGIGAFTGYVSGNTFANQPGANIKATPAHNQRIDYWLTINAQRIALGMKVGTPVYEPVYLGKILPYSTPGQYPYPVVCIGSLASMSATRFSNTSHIMGYKGNTAVMSLRAPGGTWANPHALPWSNDYLAGATSQLRDTAGVYTLHPVILHDNAANVWGELDGIAHISGFNNAVENTLVVGGKTWVVLQDVARTGFNDYYALRLD